MWDRWFHGEVHYEKYDPSRGAAWYVSKHFRRSQWGGFLGAEPVRLRRRKRSRGSRSRTLRA
jgi:hypothetical protein